MSARRPPARVALLSLALGGCAATPAITPGVPHVVARVVIAPYESHRECVRLASGDRVDYEYASSAPLKFDIGYREGDNLLMPVVRGPSASASGTYEVLIPQRYCMTWEAGPPGAIVRYRILVRPPIR
ncbi:MAG TPA: hypothetical protein VKT00_07435 [Casimicrobiaceae bacterium]|nr:hypothetical protein [Casimicrobiaceae bacterium]